MVVSPKVQQQHEQDYHHHEQQQQQQQQQQAQDAQGSAELHKPCWPVRAWQYAKHNPLELAASTLESITLVLVVFVQDIIFKQSIPICAGLLTASFILHGLAHRAGQCQVWPKVIEVIAPLLFYGMTPAAYLATQATYRSAFIIINFWFVAAEVAAWVLLKRNFIEEYLQDWNPKEVWGTPLIRHCARAVAINWIICQVIMGLAQVAVVAANISIETNLLAGIMMCYVMQLLPLLWAVLFTFAYPARVRRRWGYKPGVRETCYPPNTPHPAANTAAADGAVSRSGAAAAAAAAGKDADALAADEEAGGVNAPKGCGWGGMHWRGLRHGLRRSGSSMLWLLGAAGSGASIRSSSGSSGNSRHNMWHMEDLRVVVGGGH